MLTDEGFEALFGQAVAEPVAEDAADPPTA